MIGHIAVHPNAVSTGRQFKRLRNTSGPRNCWLGAHDVIPNRTRTAWSCVVNQDGCVTGEDVVGLGPGYSADAWATLVQQLLPAHPQPDISDYQLIAFGLDINADINTSARQRP